MVEREEERVVVVLAVAEGDADTEGVGEAVGVELVDGEAERD